MRTIGFFLGALLLPVVLTAGCDSDETGSGGGGEAGAGVGGTGAGGGSGGTGGTGGANPNVTRIGFGSCMKQGAPKPVLEVALQRKPELFVFMGDNIYGDTTDMAVLQSKYDTLAGDADFAALRAAVPLIATWDDHDYGANDAGKEYPKKAESKEIFLNFWEEPLDSPRRTHDGIYTSYMYSEPGGTVQVILLDTRWFRDPLDPVTDPSMYKNDYQPTTDTTRTMLGAEQWAFVEAELKKPADVRIIGSSTQFGHEYNGWESWTNMPHERQKMVDLIQSTQANGVVFISGDVHWAELSKLETAGYPLYDLTSSGITEEWPVIEPNANRIGDAVAENNVGFVEIEWGDTEDKITLSLVDVDGKVRVEHLVTTTELKF
ncbi:MAG: alkaline phosphatase family protein [Polyangiaceae bacterium]|nr:alkaline phosphatase family protein [Polyangiaceae bacterium]